MLCCMAIAMLEPMGQNILHMHVSLHDKHGLVPYQLHTAQVSNISDLGLHHLECEECEEAFQSPVWELWAEPGLHVWVL